jgi:hypothetical protein
LLSSLDSLFICDGNPFSFPVFTPSTRSIWTELDQILSYYVILFHLLYPDPVPPFPFPLPLFVFLWASYWVNLNCWVGWDFWEKIGWFDSDGLRRDVMWLIDWLIPLRIRLFHWYYWDWVGTRLWDESVPVVSFLFFFWMWLRAMALCRVCVCVVFQTVLVLVLVLVLASREPFFHLFLFELIQAVLETVSPHFLFYF